MEEANLADGTYPEANVLRVLVAECDPDEQRRIGSGLERAGYNVVAVSDGFEAYRALQEYPPDVFVCWVMMPGMDGFELLASIRTDTRLQGVPVVILTTRDAKGNVIKPCPEEIRRQESFLEKPIAVQTLVEVVDTIVGIVR